MSRRQRVEISDEQFKKAITWLEDGGTKKGACEILGVSNNKTMESRIEEWHQDQEIAKRLRKEKRKQPMTDTELVNLIEHYFDGSSFEDLSKTYYRSTTYIKHKLQLAGALIREKSAVSPLDPPLLPEECVLLEEDFQIRQSVSFEASSLSDYENKKKQILSDNNWNSSQVVDVHTKVGKWDTHCRLDLKGEMVWLPGYQCLAEVIKKVPSKQGSAYKLYLMDESKHQYVNAMYWDIGSLRHLELLGAKISNRGTYLNATSCQELLNEALRAAKKSK